MNEHANILSIATAQAGSPARYDMVGDGVEHRLIPDQYSVYAWVVAAFFIIFCGAGLNASAEPAVATNIFVGPSTAALPETGASVVRVFGALVLVIAIFLGGVWLFRNWQRFAIKKGGGAKLNLIEVKSLGQRQALYVVGYQDQRMLLASSPAGITLLSHLPAAEETAKESVPAAAPKMSFSEAFQHVLNRKS